MTVPYTRLQIRLHWVIFALIALQYLFHESIVAAWLAAKRGETVAFDPLVAGHVFGGIAILVLVLWRIWARVKFGAPPLPEEEAPAMQMLAKLTHLGLYLMMLTLPFSGLAAWFGGIDAAAEAHEVMRLILLVLIVLHVVGALYHQFVLKTGLMQRMRTPGGQA